MGIGVVVLGRSMHLLFPGPLHDHGVMSLRFVAGRGCTWVGRRSAMVLARIQGGRFTLASLGVGP